MKVLHLPYNVASLASTSVQILNKYGVEAKGIVIAANVVTTTDSLISKPPYIRKKNYAGIKQRIEYINDFYKLIKWADVLHWYWNEAVLPFSLDFKFKKFFNKPGVVEWLGSDIRILEWEFRDNKYYEHVSKKYGQDFKVTDYSSSLAVQQLFKKNNFKPVATTGISQYIIKEVFPEYFHLNQRILSDSFEPQYPKIEKEKPLVIHSPTSPEIKGTEYVLQAVESLKVKYDFDFKLIQNMPRRDALALMQQCDIYVDQLIGGGHGLAACEAMAFGKPVICFIKDALLKEYPKEIPIVNANPDNITEKLEVLIKDAQLRNQIGKQGRAYIDKHHSEKYLAGEMIKIYEQVIAENKNR
jgi:glycosyltransferase involved in cell wall biosynthesis